MSRSHTHTQQTIYEPTMEDLLESDINRHLMDVIKRINPADQNRDFINLFIEFLRDTHKYSELCIMCKELSCYKCENCKIYVCGNCAIAHATIYDNNHSIILMDSADTPSNSPPNSPYSNSTIHKQTDSSLSSPLLATEMSESPTGMKEHDGWTYQEWQYPYSFRPTLCEHENSKIYYCDTCENAICVICLYAFHKDHAYRNLYLAFNEAKCSNIELVHNSNSMIKELKESLIEINKTIKRVENAAKLEWAYINYVAENRVTLLKQHLLQIYKDITIKKCDKTKELNFKAKRIEHFLKKHEEVSKLLSESTDYSSPVRTIIKNKRALDEIISLKIMHGTLIFQKHNYSEHDSTNSNDTNFEQDTENFSYVATSPSKFGAIGEIPPNRLLPLRSNLAVDKQNLIGFCSSFSTENSQFDFQFSNKPLDRVCALQTRKHVAFPTLEFGKGGDKNEEFCRPWGICCDRNGNYIVADRSNNRIQMFKSHGNFLMRFGKQGNEPGSFDRPAGVAVTPKNEIVVADKDNHRIQVFTENGKFKFTFGSKGSNDGQFNYPWDVDVSSEGSILVSDTRNHRIQIFDKQGNFIFKYVMENNFVYNNKQMESPRGVSFLNNEEIIFSDFNHHRLVVINIKTGNKRFIGSEGSGQLNLMRPQGVAIDHDGHVFVADSKNNRIQIFNVDGAYVDHIGNNDGFFDRPCGICVTPDGKIAVVDFGNDRVLVY